MIDKDALKIAAALVVGALILSVTVALNIWLYVTLFEYACK